MSSSTGKPKCERCRDSTAGEDGVYKVHDLANPNHVVGYFQDYVEDAYRRAGLTVEHTIPGYWAGESGMTGQDIIVARK